LDFKAFLMNWYLVDNDAQLGATLGAEKAAPFSRSSEECSV
jgi:hypothetical protein